MLTKHTNKNMLMEKDERERDQKERSKRGEIYLKPAPENICPITRILKVTVLHDVAQEGQTVLKVCCFSFIEPTGGSMDLSFL